MSTVLLIIIRVREMPHHDRPSNVNGTVVARILKSTPIMFLTEEYSRSLTVPGHQWTGTVSTAGHTTHHRL